MKRQTLTNLNIETIFFFIILFFLFLIGVLLIEKDPKSASTFLGIVGGALMGFVYLYKIGRLKISKGKRYPKIDWDFPPKKIATDFQKYYLICGGIMFVGYIIGEIVLDIEDLGFVFLGGWMGTIVVLGYFYGLRKFNISKEEATKLSQEEE